MEPFDPQTVHLRLESILESLKAGDAEAAGARIAGLLSQLEALGESRPAGTDQTNRKPEPWKLVAAHLRATQVHLELTHLAVAQSTIETAIGVLLDGGGPLAPRL